VRVVKQNSVALILLIIVATSFAQLSSTSTDLPVYCSFPSEIPSPSNTLAETDVALTWTSRWSATPQAVTNETEIVGEHIVLNATFAEDLNVTWTKMSLLDGIHEIISDGNSVILDTYLLGHNSTVEISVTGNTSGNTELSYSWHNITLSNFFAPRVNIDAIEDINGECYNITWTSFDQNEDDVNYYQVWISADGGLAYQLIGANLNKTHFLWDSTGFLRTEYYIKIRAFSLDFTFNNLCSVDNPPSSYWPGDYGDSQPIEVLMGDVTTGPNPGWFQVSLDHPADITYLEFSTGNTIVWTPIVDGWLIYYIEYNVNLNDSIWTSGRYYLGLNESVVVNIDGLSVGLYEFEIVFGSISDSVLVRVIESQLGMLIHFGAIGVSIGSSFVILIVVILTLRLRREYYAHGTNP